MKSCILKSIDEVQRRKLSNNGVIFYDWSQDIVVTEDQMPLVLELLDATAEEKHTDYEGMVEVVLKLRATSAVKTKEPVREQPLVRKVNPAIEKARLAYIKASKQRLKAQLDSAQASLDKLQLRLPDLGGKLAGLTRRDFLRTVPADQEELRARSLEEFRRLRAVPKVLAARVVNGAILVYTDVLHATGVDGDTREIGSFLIVIGTAGGNLPIRWFNQTRQVHALKPSMQAPYVLQDGSPVVHEMQETFIQLIAQLEFSVVAELAIQFIETVNSDEPGKFHNCWPLSTRTSTPSA